jgi:lipoate-protein ligase A
VVVGHRKIVGLAQVRRRGSVLLVAGLQLAQPDWPLLAQALGRPAGDAAALAACNTSCEQEAGGGDWLNAVAGPLRQALSYALFHLPQAQAEAADTAAIY